MEWQQGRFGINSWVHLQADHIQMCLHGFLREGDYSQIVHITPLRLQRLFDPKKHFQCEFSVSVHSARGSFCISKGQSSTDTSVLQDYPTHSSHSNIVQHCPTHHNTGHATRKLMQLAGSSASFTEKLRKTSVSILTFDIFNLRKN